MMNLIYLISLSFFSKSMVLLPMHLDPLLALEHLKINSKSYELILADIRMPGMNGFELVKKVRSIHPIIKILLMSAFEFDNLELSTILTPIKIDC